MGKTSKQAAQGPTGAPALEAIGSFEALREQRIAELYRQPADCCGVADPKIIFGWDAVEGHSDTLTFCQHHGNNAMINMLAKGWTILDDRREWRPEEKPAGAQDQAAPGGDGQLASDDATDVGRADDGDGAGDPVPA